MLSSVLGMSLTKKISIHAERGVCLGYYSLFKFVGVKKEVQMCPKVMISVFFEEDASKQWTCPQAERVSLPAERGVYLVKVLHEGVLDLGET